MTEQEIKNKIKGLPNEDKQILSLKIKSLMAKSSQESNTIKSKKLIAFIKKNEIDDLGALKSFLKKNLPDYMVPTKIFSIDDFPFLPNGKIDRKKIIELKPAYNNTKEPITLETEHQELERKLISIWEEVLGIKPIYPNDNFFEIGGDSILSIQVISAAKKQGIQLKANQLFEHQTISELALVIKSNNSEKANVNNNILNALTTIWEDVLGFGPIKPDDNFFEIGGDSILSIQIVAKAKKLGIQLSANQLFENQTISELVLVLNEQTSLKTNNQSQLEATLKGIWEDVLGFSPVKLDDNFFEIGGDSILSIQITAKARKAGIFLKANQIFEHQTISEIVNAVESNNQNLILKEDSKSETTQSIPLTPIQHWFFDTHKVAPHYWNQIVEIKSKIKIDKGHFQKSIKELVSTHSALRLKFSNDTEAWMSHIKPVDDTHYFEEIVLTGDSIDLQNREIEQELFEIQNRINLSDGNLFKAIYFNCNSIQQDRMVLVAHHLVIDVVSWSIIFNHISKKFNDPFSVDPPNYESTDSANIKDWSQYLSKTIPTAINETSYWEGQYNPDENFLSDFKTDQIVYPEKSIFTISESLNEYESDNLNIKSGKIYNTKPEDILVVALIKTLGEWSHLDNITLGLERQGRTLKNLDLEFSNTIGWFTSYFPLSFTFDKNSGFEKQIKNIKETLRGIPNNGIGFGVLNYLKRTDNQLLNKIKPKVVFNYLGKIQSGNEASKIQFKSSFDRLARHPESERLYEIEINTYFKDNILITNWSFTNLKYKEDTAKTLVKGFLNNLRETLEHCMGKGDYSYTPSDFPEVNLSQDDLDNLLSQF